MPIFYNATTPSTIKYISNSANAQMKDCFNGEVEINTRADTYNLDVWLDRPIGRFYVVATNADKFADAANLKDYKARIRYPLYYPSSLHLFDNTVSDVNTNVEREFSIEWVDDERVILGFDYALLNNSSNAGLDIQVYLISPSGEEYALTGVLNVPMKRGQTTYVIGDFINNDNYVDGNGGIKIDYRFEGEYNIYL
jgi:hypothetical protein